MDILDEEVVCRFRNVKAGFVVENTLIKVPIILLGVGEWDSFHI